MKFSKVTCVFQFLLFMLILPALAVIKGEGSLLGIVLLCLIVMVSIAIVYSAKLVVDPAHKRRVISEK